MSHRIPLDDGSVVTLPLPYLSHSQVSMYLRCPRQYFHRYIEGHKEPPGWTLSVGLSGHGALEMNNLAKIETGEDLPSRTVVERMADDLAGRFHAEQSDLVIVENGKQRKVTGKDLDTSVQDLTARLNIYMDEDAPSITPLHAEREHRAVVGGVPLLAYTDLETANAVWDYKFGNSRRTTYAQPKAADQSLQLSLYSILTGSDRVGYYVFLPGEELKTKTNPPEVRKVGSTRNEGERTCAAYVVQEVARAISSGAFPLCPPDNFLCSPEYCGFWHRCKGRLLEGKPPIITGPRETTDDEQPLPPPPPKPKRSRS